MAKSVAPRVLFVGHTHYDLPLMPSLARKWDALSAHLELRVLGAAGVIAAPDSRFRLLGQFGPSATALPAFWSELPIVAALEIRRFRPDVVVAQSPYEALAVLPALRTCRRARPRLVVEVHGDWRTAAACMAPLSDPPLHHSPIGPPRLPSVALMPHVP